MLSFSSLVLAFIHAIYSFILAFSSRVNTATKKSPLALDAPRRRIPSHLAILFVTDEEVDITAATAAFIQSVEGAVEWCRMAGIEDLAVYDRQGN
jgi:dehydrodolichyl diphosphate syntase complex subunit NUS1